VEVKVQGNIERALKKLKNTLNKEGVFKELKNRRYYEKPSIKEKRKRLEARKKRAKSSRFNRSG
jgi:small subunit ribosomal protein S21